jgi:hypothetical protein
VVEVVEEHTILLIIEQVVLVELVDTEKLKVQLHHTQLVL